MRLDFLTLRTRINLGFALICALLCVAGATSFYGFSQGKNHFLHFVRLRDEAALHVKMAGEASEFLYNANKLKNIATENMGVIQQSLFYDIQRTAFLTLSVAITASMIGIALS